MVFPEEAELLTLGIRDDLFVPVSDEKRQQTRHTLEVANDEIVFSFWERSMSEKVSICC